MHISSIENADEETDVLVVGYGPTGATIASLLGQAGWHVVVIDQAADIYDKPRAITADQEVLRVFQQIGIAEEVEQTATPHPGTDYVGMKGQIIKRFYPAPPPEPLGWTPNWMFVQPELEATMRRKVANVKNIEARLQHKLLNYKQDALGVVATVERLEDDSRVTLRSRYLIAADGAGSSVRKQMSPQIEDLAFDEWWLVVDAWIRGPVDLPHRCVQYCRPSRPGTYIVGPGTLRRWEIKMLPHETPDQFDNHDAVWKVLGEFVDTSALEHCRTAVYRFHALVIEQWRQNRIFLMGDAAHQMPPFLGQGLCAGVRDAFNLAWKLDLVMRNKASPNLLDTYCEERKRHVRTVVGHAKSFGLIIGELDEAAARVRDQRMQQELVSGTAETIRQRFIPGLEAGLIDKDSDAVPSFSAGELFVQPWVRQSEEPWKRLDDVLGARFAIVATSLDLLDGLGLDLSARWKSLDGQGIVVKSVAKSIVSSVGTEFIFEERDDLLSKWLNEREAVAVIARPDRYVYGIARSLNDLIRLVTTLCEILTPDYDRSVAIRTGAHDEFQLHSSDLKVCT